MHVAAHRQVRAATARGTGRWSACRCRARACRASPAGSRRRSRPGRPSGRTWSARPGCSALKSLQQLQRMRVVGARARLLVQARHRLEVVVHHVGRRRLQDLERAVERGRGNRAPASRSASAGESSRICADAVDEMAGAAVAQVVAVDAGDDHVVQLQRGDRLARGSPARRRRADRAGRGRRRRTGSGACTCRP